MTVASPLIPQGTKGDRFTSFDVDAFEVPSGREEDWRFTPLKRLAGLHKGIEATGKTAITVGGTADGVTAQTVDRADARLGEAAKPADKVAAAAYTGFTEALVVEFAKDTQAAEPVMVTIDGPGEGQVAYGHIQIRAEQFAEGTVVLDYRGSGAYGENVEFVIADGARLNVVAVHDWADDAVHVTAHHAKVGRDAVLRHMVVTLGGDLVRVSPTVNYADRGGDAECLGLYFSDAGQHHEHRLFMDHSTPNCRSNVVYKGALQGKDAHAVWIGDVLIRVAAEATETFELNRNLLLTDGARADSVPNLEIETGEITGAGHASATGRFDDEQLFYLQARGIPAEQARRLVVRGFFNELLHKIPVSAVRERLEAAIEAELEAVGT
ncbi:Fe-S cluster assembly protein SufD [Pseudonocardiaceae bacterium YIM PH 21723]|nr:Fe-S cluster assembly protein SufD [Pseudonocardiaceae bacterium YIM PH 21723]